MESHWKKELEKESLKEPEMKSKIFWIKPLSFYHHLEYRGIDVRDKYKPTVKDEWDLQVWNVPTLRRGKCKDYLVDFIQCHKYLTNHYAFLNFGYYFQRRYCWKPYVNYSHCLKHGDEDHHHDSHNDSHNDKKHEVHH